MSKYYGIKNACATQKARHSVTEVSARKKGKKGRISVLFLCFLCTLLFVTFGILKREFPDLYKTASSLPTAEFNKTE